TETISLHRDQRVHVTETLSPDMRGMTELRARRLAADRKQLPRGTDLADAPERSGRGGTTRPVKIGVVADIHCGPDADTQLGSQAPVLLEGFCDAMEAFGPDLLVDLGDRINPVAGRQDRQRTVWVRRRLLEIGVPVHHVLGNTDVGNLTKSELGPLLEQGTPYACADRYDPRIVLLDSQDHPLE